MNTFNKAVDDIVFMASTTRIDTALRLAQKELFSPKNGGRPGVPKILILLTGKCSFHPINLVVFDIRFFARINSDVSPSVCLLRG